MANALDFFTPEAGQRRRAWLNRQGERALNALGRAVPPATRPAVGNALMLADMFNPVSGVGEAMLGGRQAYEGQGWDRVQGVGRALSGTAATVAPLGAGARGVDDAARVVSDAFLGWSPARQGAADNALAFARDESGALSAGAARAANETPAQEVARLLREGRASEVTDDMMAAVDPQEMYRLYESGATGMDMPMDEASRMARAREMGFDGEFYHGTQNGSFPAFRTSPHDEIDLAGVSVTPDAAEANWYAANRPDFNPGMDRADPAVLPVTTRGQYGDETDILFAPEDMPTSDIVQGMDGVDFSQFNERYVFNPTNIRSRFARFDPRLKHLANLSAGVGAVGVGSLATQPAEAGTPEIQKYLDRYGPETTAAMLGVSVDDMNARFGPR